MLKTANRFSATARWVGGLVFFEEEGVPAEVSVSAPLRVLVGSKLSIHMNSPEVVVSIIK